MVFAAASASAAACGGSGPTTLKPGRPLASGEDRLFENGVDLVADPGQLSGRWREDWDRELQGRVGRADLVLLFRVATVRTDIDPDRRRTHRLEGTVQRVLFGSWPEGERDLTLRVADTEPGFGTIEGREQQVMGTTFVAFLRVVPTDAGGVQPRWHLSPATASVVDQTKALLERRQRVARRAPGRRRRVH